MVKQTILNVVVDVNFYIDSLKGRGVVSSLAELYAAMPILAEIVSSPNVSLVDSEHIVRLLKTKLVEVNAYTEEEAAVVCDLVIDIAAASSGTYVDLETGAESGRYLEGLINPRFLGPKKGQVDHEDLQVLGAARAALISARQRSMVVSRDGGVLNTAGDIEGAGVLVQHPRESAALVRAVARHS